MKSNHLNLSIGCCIFLLIAEVAFAQDLNRTLRDTVPPSPPTWRYGGVPDDSARFGGAQFDDAAHFSGATFDSLANFWRATFDSLANFWRATFDSPADFSSAQFDNLADFSGATFVDAAYFNGAKFDDAARFGGAKFDDVADFSSAKFDDVASFRRATFDSQVSFYKAQFDSLTVFVNTRFGGTVIFVDTDFRQGVDFRQTSFDSVHTLHLENITFPEGKLRFYWHQFQGKDSRRIKLINPPPNSLKQEHYTRIEIIYHRLRDNFLAQDDKASADAVMYELGWQKKEILGEFRWKMYGFFFGYGFQPWRFLFFVVAPLIVLFAGIWYWFYYGMLVFINPNLSPQITTENPLGQKEKYLIQFKNVKSIKIRFNDFSSLRGNINRLTRYWHAILFSAGVLFGIRFKEKWAQACPDNILGRKTFIYCVTFQWLLGIGLIVTFALLVKGSSLWFHSGFIGFLTIAHFV